MKPSITIVYCNKCGWMLRAAYFAQELLNTFTGDIKEVSLRPGEDSGQFYIYVDEHKIFDRKAYGGFPETSVLKQMVRDKVNPGKNLGHSDRKLPD